MLSGDLVFSLAVELTTAVDALGCGCGGLGPTLQVCTICGRDDVTANTPKKQNKSSECRQVPAKFTPPGAGEVASMCRYANMLASSSY